MRRRFYLVCEHLGLTNRWSQPLAVVMTTFDLMKPFSMFPRSLPPAVAQLRLVRC